MFVYADHAATSSVSEEVLRVTLDAMKENYGNPSSLSLVGRKAAEAAEAAKRRMADALGCGEDEIFYTSGGTESDNWALRGCAAAAGLQRNHLLTSSVEHRAVLETAKELERKGFAVTYLPVDETGCVSLNDVRASLTEKTFLVSVMTANNEVGTVQPISEIVSFAHAAGVPVHTDAVQAIGKLPFSFDASGLDFLSLSGHKIRGPKGIGALLVRRGTSFRPLLFGGGQQRGLRSGTENVPGILGLAEATVQAVSHQRAAFERASALQKRLIEALRARLPFCVINTPQNALPGFVSVSVAGISGETAVVLLDAVGICASAGSACASASPDASYVLRAMGRDEATARGTVRFSLSEENTEEEVDYISEQFPRIVEQLRVLNGARL